MGIGGYSTSWVGGYCVQVGWVGGYCVQVGWVGVGTVYRWAG